MLKIGLVLVFLLIFTMFFAAGAKEAAAEAKKQDFVIGFANGYFGNTWRAQFIDSAKKVADKWIDRGVIKEFKIVQVNDDVTKQLVQLNSLIDQGVDCLVINPVSAEALTPVINRAKREGVLVVNVDDPFAFEGVPSVVLDQKPQIGISARWLCEQLKDKKQANIVHIHGLAGNTADNVRVEEVHRILAEYPNIKIIAEAPGGWNQTAAQEVMSNFLSTYPNIDGVLCHDIMAEGVMRAYDIAGKSFPLMVADYQFSTLRIWNDLAKKSDFKSVIVTCPPGVGADGVEVAVRLLLGYKLKPEILQPSPVNPNIVNTVLLVPPVAVTNDGIAYDVLMKDYPSAKGFLQFISIEDAVKLGEDLPGTSLLDRELSDEELDALFIIPEGAKVWN